MTDTLDDPIALLEAGHRSLREQFAAYRELSALGAAAVRRQAHAEQACLALTIQSKLEEELVYPRLREAAPGDLQIDAIEDEHAFARELMCQVLVMNPAREQYDATVGTLGEYVERHTRRESELVFPRLRRCTTEPAALARLLRERRRELEAVPEALREDALASTLAA